MKKFDNYPMLESVLGKLLNKTEKSWGYVQIHKREKVYVVRLLGSDEDTLTLDFDESNHLYKLYWYGSSNPGVFVEVKNNKTYNKASKTYQSLRTYEVCCKAVSQPVISSINNMFAELVKDKILQFFAQNPPEENKKVAVRVISV